MITPAPAPKQPQIIPLDWVGDPEQCPQWVGFPTRAGLPAGLKWSGKGEVPAIGARVHIYMNGIGPAEVKAYFHAEGWLGVLCQPDTMPEHLRKHGVTLGHFFGRELEPYTPGPAAAPQVPEVVEIEPVADPIGKAQEHYNICVAREDEDRRYYRAKQREAKQAYPHDQEKQQQHCQDALQMVELAMQRTQQAKQALASAEQLHSQDGPEQADDWIPEYPPQGDELADDNHDSSEYPEHPADEQRD
ncbi:hypothetical protein ACFST9_14320 [Hymenobacter monticola]|uniref:Uncharacterized protein n=1 Tax=Hymenobacter monticola TaxID=1705399 RepID=A0ABY4BC28_9BACT|nr:hypothetical protein [Hymenobacter monticola]UOE36711.1 hypothetical protein MTP16_24800 [Hymenobacter monticola]